MIKRLLETALKSSKKSVLLLGPRQVGKSTLLQSLNPDLFINLADQETYLRFATSPGELRSQVTAHVPRTRTLNVCIDEVQRISTLLNTVQALLDEYKGRLRFLLSGSSARKLRRGKANLLPGRIHTYHLAPLASAECDYQLDTKRALALGTLPGILSDRDDESARKTLRSYGATYLKEEIQAEALSRNMEGFARFLDAVSSWSSELVDYTKIASQAMIARQSARRYFEILEDTLIFYRLDPFTLSTRKRLIQHPKFYIFDTGVMNGLIGNFLPTADRVGKIFETLILSQLQAAIQAFDIDARLSFFLTEHGAEVDFILEKEGDVFCIEVKASAHIDRINRRGLDAFSNFYGKPHAQFVFYLGATEKKINGVTIIPWQEGLRRIGL